MDMLQIVLPTCHLDELVALSDSALASWIQVAKIGTFHSKRYGKFEITPVMLMEMLNNSQTAGTRMLVDYDHLSLEPQFPEQGKAAGWFSKLELRNGNRELWGLVEWTPRAAELIRNKEYQYVSPTFVKTHQDKLTGKSGGARLVCAAITNHPFLPNMAAVTLSETAVDTPIFDAVQSKVPDATIVDIFDDHVVVRQGDGKLLRLDYLLGDSGSVTFPSEPLEVVHNYVPVAKPHTTATPVSDNGGNGMPEETNKEIVALSERVTQQESTITSLRDELNAERLSRQKLEIQLNTERANRKVLDLIKAGKLAKKQQDWAVKYALNDPEGFDEYATTLDPIVDLGRERGDAGQQQVESKDPIVELSEKVTEYIAGNGGRDKVKYSDAMRAVTLQNPELAERYRAAMASVKVQ